MKKFLLSLAAFAALSTVASALTPKHITLPQNPPLKFASVEAPQLSSPLKAPAKAAEMPDTMVYNLAGSPYQVLGGFSAGYKIAAAFCISAEESERFAGAKIKSVNFYTGIRQTNSSTSTAINYITDYTVFVTNDLQGERICEQAHKASRRGWALQTAELDEPIVIEGGKEYYIGYECASKSANDYPVTIDYLNHNGNIDGGWFYFFNEEVNAYVWDNFADFYGFNCISATLSSDQFPVNEATAEILEAPVSTLTDTPFDFQVYITNNAANDIENVEFTYTIGDGEPVSASYSFEAPVSFGQSDYFTVEGAVCATPGNQVLKGEITKINGEPNNLADAGFALDITFSVPGSGFLANVVGEEFTSVYCGYCPLGFSTMEAMCDKYPDRFFMVGVHADMATGNDPMTQPSFMSLLSDFAGGLPSSVINRAYDCDPRDSENLQSYYLSLTQNLLPYGVSAVAEFSADMKSVYVKTNTQFAFDTDNTSDRYQLSYVVLEDSVGPYTQLNYYSGQAGAGEWTNQPGSVSILFNNVGRYLDGYPGLPNSVPADIKAGADNTHVRNVPITNVSNPDFMSVLVYLVDTNTNRILNACRVKSSDILSAGSGIPELGTDNTNAPVEYYNLQGVRVINPTPGLYIRRQGNEVKKIIL